MLEQEATCSKQARSKILLLVLASACNITLVYNPLIVTNTTEGNTALTIQILLFHRYKKQLTVQFRMLTWPHWLYSSIQPLTRTFPTVTERAAILLPNIHGYPMHHRVRLRTSRSLGHKIAIHGIFFWAWKMLLAFSMESQHIQILLCILKCRLHLRDIVQKLIKFTTWAAWKILEQWDFYPIYISLFWLEN
jgi:hypothetical protein